MSLFKIQAELNAPKNQINKFGNYKYRSCEDIVEAVKPILAKYEVSLLITDDIVLIGDRYYVKATAKLIGESINVEVSAFAREELNKKGMADAQLTGATSSYARKYALNGLFAIDDSKDDDNKDNRQDTTKKPPTLNEYLKRKGIKDIKGFALFNKIKSKEDAEKLLSDTAGLDELISAYNLESPAQLP